MGSGATQAKGRRYVQRTGDQYKYGVVRVTERVTLNPSGLAPPTGSPATPYYSWVVARGPVLSFSGMVPEDENERLVGDDLGSQARQVFENLKTAAEAAGAALQDICSVTVYVTATDLQRDVYPFINPLFAEYFPTEPPARTLVGGVALPYPEFLIEVAAQAVLGKW